MNPKRVVVKIGTSLLTHEDGRLHRPRMARLVREISFLHRSRCQVILVTSGAIAAGMGELGWKKRPAGLAKKQAAAAVGQPRLMENYRQLFRHQEIRVAQVLLTREDFEDSRRRLNAQHTLWTLLRERVVPIINENDTVAVDEIRVGDNDTLAARVAVKMKADLLILLTDVDGLMTRHPRHGRGELIRRVEHIGATIESLAHAVPGSEAGTGGMMTKIRAARLAVREGVPMVIGNGLRINTIRNIFSGVPTGTLFVPRQ